MRTNLRIQESREKDYYYSATKENSPIQNFVKCPKIGNSRKLKHTKISRSTVFILQASLPVTVVADDVCQQFSLCGTES